MVGMVAKYYRKGHEVGGEKWETLIFLWIPTQLRSLIYFSFEEILFGCYFDFPVRIGKIEFENYSSDPDFGVDHLQVILKCLFEPE